MRAVEHVLWDVVEEHLEEATFGVQRFEDALMSPLRTLDDLARHPEARLLAHLDGLVVGGEPVRSRLLEPVLGEPGGAEPARITVAVWAQLEAGAFACLEPALGHVDPRVRGAVVRAVGLARHRELSAWLSRRFSSPCPGALRVGLLEACAARALPAPDLREALEQGETPLTLAAAQAARFGDRESLREPVEALLDHPAWSVREAALLACLPWGSALARERCSAWGLDAAQPSQLATQLCALLGRPDQHRRLGELPPSAPWLFALGFTGSVALWPVLLPFLHGNDPLFARLAAQSLGMLFGFRPDDPAYTLADAEPLRDDEPPSGAGDDLDADLVPAPEQALPAPHAGAIEALCEERAPSLRATRVLYGAPLSAAHLSRVLHVVPLRIRHVLAHGLHVWSRGTAWLDSRATTAIQREQLRVPAVLHELS